jgi:hypothetical protein
VQLSKDRLELQAKVNVVENMDMCTKVKQLGVNMQEQVIIVLMPFFDFMDSLKILKACCLFSCLILDPRTRV